MELYVQYGCGLTAPSKWFNYDASPTLRIQNIPVLYHLLRNKLNTVFPVNVKYGDIVKGLPVPDNSCRGIFCSHVLEHLSYQDFQRALKNTYKILSKNGLFRLVMPDLQNLITAYMEAKKNGNPEAAIIFMKNSGMALEKRKQNLKSILENVFGNSKHLWLWDADATIVELKKIGFVHIRTCKFNDSADPMFNLVEDLERFKDSFAMEMIKE